MNKPTKEEISKIDLSSLYPLITNNEKNYLVEGAGVEHYKLLGWISQQVNKSTIIEIGTLSGIGLIALSLNPTNQVVSYDIRDYKWKNIVPKNGVRRIVSSDYMDFVVKSPIIFYDAAHEGKEEKEFFDELVKRNWKGVLFLDDIHLNKEMEQFWKYVQASGLKFEDWTDIGHAVGTGVVWFA